MTNGISSQKRIEWIDIARGFAILFVIFGHTISTPRFFSEFIYFFHMPLFFALSGYCFSTKNSFLVFLQKKAKSLLIPLFSLGLTGSIVVAVAMKLFKGTEIDWKYLLLNPIIQYGNHDLLWYLPTLLVAFIVFYGLCKLFQKHPKILLLISFILAGIAYVTVKHTRITVPWHIDTALIALPFLSIAYLAKTYGIAEKLKSFIVLIISFFLCAVVGFINVKFFGSIDMHTGCYGNIILFYISSLAGIVMIVSLSMIISHNVFLEFCGKNSIIFYSLEPVQYFTNYILKIMSGFLPFNDSIVLKVLVTFLAVALIVLLCSFASYIINRFFPFMIGKKRESKSVA